MSEQLEAVEKRGNKRSREDSISTSSDGSDADSDDNDSNVNIDSSSNKASKPRKWSVEEDDLLKEGVQKFGESKWKKIAEIVGTRNHYQCIQRWKKILRPGIVKGAWTGDEDTLLVMLVSQGFKNWGKLAKQMPGRTAKQCRERWCNYLDPQVNKADFSTDEDKYILEQQKVIGNKWSEIARGLPGRTENSVKIRFKALSRCVKSGVGVESIRHRLKQSRSAADIFREHVLPSEVTTEHQHHISTQILIQKNSMNERSQQSSENNAVLMSISDSSNAALINAVGVVSFTSHDNTLLNVHNISDVQNV